MKIPRICAAVLASGALLLTAALPSSAASSMYWSGPLVAGATKSSAIQTVKGGRTSIGASTGPMIAVNQSAERGYAFHTATGIGQAISVHSTTRNATNRASWRSSPHISGTLGVQGFVHY